MSRRSSSMMRPWIIWIENMRDRAWFLLVLSPKVGRFTRRVKLNTAYTLGPVFYRDKARESEVVSQLISAGKEMVPDSIPYRVSMSLADTQEILKETWGVG